MISIVNCSKKFNNKNKIVLFLAKLAYSRVTMCDIIVQTHARIYNCNYIIDPNN